MVGPITGYSPELVLDGNISTPEGAAGDSPWYSSSSSQGLSSYLQEDGKRKLPR